MQHNRRVVRFALQSLRPLMPPFHAATAELRAIVSAVRKPYFVTGASDNTICIINYLKNKELKTGLRAHGAAAAPQALR